MSEVQSRPSPSAPRGGRGGRSGRGGFNTRGRGGRINGDKSDAAPVAPSIEEDGEIVQLKKKYGTKIQQIQDFFPDWTDEDCVFALQETDGELEPTINRIADGKPPAHTRARTKRKT
jgi:hypothetical protein